MRRSRIRPIELIVGVGGSIAVLAVLLAKPPWWEAAAIVLATLLPAGLVLYGATAARRARDRGGRRGGADAPAREPGPRGR